MDQAIRPRIYTCIVIALFTVLAQALGIFTWPQSIFAIVLAYPAVVAIPWIRSRVRPEIFFVSAIYLGCCASLELLRATLDLAHLTTIVEGAKSILWNIVLLVPSLLGLVSGDTCAALTKINSAHYGFSFVNILHFAWMIPMMLLVFVFGLGKLIFLGDRGIGRIATIAATATVAGAAAGASAAYVAKKIIVRPFGDDSPRKVDA